MMSIFRRFLGEAPVGVGGLTGRSALPQIRDVDDFRRWCAMQRNILSDIKLVNVAQLRPMQDIIDDEKAFSIKRKEVGDNLHNAPILISANLQILDGHHRWYAAYRIWMVEEVFAVVFDCASYRLSKAAQDYMALSTPYEP